MDKSVPVKVEANKTHEKLPFETVESEVVVDQQHHQQEQQQSSLVKLESELFYLNTKKQRTIPVNFVPVVRVRSDVDQAPEMQLEMTIGPEMDSRNSESCLSTSSSELIVSHSECISTSCDLLGASNGSVSGISLGDNDTVRMTCMNIAKVAADAAAAVADDPQNYEEMQVIETLEGESETPILNVSPCLICGDRGSGFHYSAYSCEGCKGFFKRTVQKNMVYGCKESGGCSLNKFTRNNCQYCRFQKCLEVGMKKEAVREDRTPGGKHRPKKARLDGSERSIQVQLQLEEWISRLTEAKSNFVPRTEDIFGGNSNYAANGPSVLDMEDLMHFGYMELRFIIEWARRVPGFGDLLLDDQMALLKSSFMELNVLRLAFRSLNCNGCVKFAEGIVMSTDQCSTLGCGQDLIKCTMEFISRLRYTNIDNTEFCILNAIVLSYPDAAGIVDKPSVTGLQNQMLDCLQHYSMTRYPEEPLRYGKILLRLPALRTISAKAAEMFLSLSLEGNIKMNALVIEMMN